jgi:hypothetical protein
VKKENCSVLSEKLLGFVKNRSVFLKAAPLFSGVCEFFIASFFKKNCSVLFETKYLYEYLTKFEF